MCFSAKKIDFYNVTVINEENERKVSVSKIIQCCPNLEEFCFYGKSDSSNITSSTVKELLEIPHFSKIKIFELKNISQLFDIETLYDSFLKENKTMGIHLDFARNISINYKKTLEKITDKILTSKTNGFWPPKITANFNQKEDEMNSAHFQYSKNCSCHRYI
uniref:Uncharacterized protein n=1 Tax=Panagrolaimus sp. ES5 TaxID=591445 RepID=A0AC34F6T0_9BILA